MKKLLGPHLGGQWTNRLEILHKWQPPLVLVLQPEVDKVQQLKAACPGAIVIGRFYHDDNYYASNISARPKEFAREIHQEIVNNPVTPLLDYVQSNNETNQDWQGIQRLNEYTSEWMFLADQSGVYKCAIMAFSVGNPDLPNKPGDPAGFDGKMLYWQQILPSLNYAQQKNHILLMHAYGYPDMFHPDADWYIYRYERQVQANLKTLGITNLKYAYGEIGIDRLIVNGKGGYKVNTTDQGYVNQLLQWEKDLQDQNLLLGGAIFTFGDSGGWDTYDIASANVANMLADHYVFNAGDYDTAEGETLFIPVVGEAPRDIDSRATQRGVTILPARVQAGDKYWRVVRVQWFDEQQSQGRHHIYIDTLDEQGKRVTGVPIRVDWPTGNHLTHTEAKPSEPWAANYPMSPSRNEFSVAPYDGSGKTDIVQGIGMGAETPGGFNAGVHTSTGVVFQLATVPKGQTPEPTLPPAPTPVPVGNEWERSIEWVLRWEGGFADNPLDPGGATNKGITLGTYTRWREAHGQPPPTKDDLRNISDAEVRQIYRDWYWNESGANALNWPLCLMHFNIAVNGGPARAKQFLSESGGNFLLYVATAMEWYTRIDGWRHFGAAWTRRNADVLREAAK